MKGEYDIVNNRYLRVLTASLVALVLVLGAGACIGPLAPCAIEEQFEEITEGLLTPEAASPEATPGVPIATPPLPTTTPIPPTAIPTLEAVSTTYTNASLGFSMRYLEDWVYEEDEEQVIFATSQQVIEGDEMETGAAMLVMAQDLEGETIEDVVETVTSLVLSGEDIQRRDPEPRAIGGLDGTITTFEGTPEGAEVPMRGFLAAVEYEGWGYFFFGVSVSDEWPEYGSDLEAMLDSVGFMARTRPEPVPTEAFTPDDWEPDDSLANASLIQVGDTQTHNLHVEGDHDWVYFEAEEGTVYIIQTSNLGDDIDTIIYLYDEAENELAYDDDEGDEYLASRVEWTAEEDGTFYLMVRDFDDAAAGPGAEYDVSVSEM